MQKSHIVALSLICLSGLAANALQVSAKTPVVTKTVAQTATGPTLLSLEARIAKLEAENARMESMLQKLWGIAGLSNSGSSIVINSGSTQTGMIVKGVTNPTYATIITKVHAELPTLLANANINASGAVVGLFEFIEPNAFFISIDDGNNPAGVNAFRYKLLYTYTNDYAFTPVGVFELDFNVLKYKTLFGNNPFVKAIRVKVTDPSYAGKILERNTVTPNLSSSGVTTNNAVSASAQTASGSTVSVTDVENAYNGNKILSAITLSQTYLKNDPTNITVMRILYRSLYLVGRLADALNVVDQIATVSGTTLDNVVACDGQKIAEMAKNTAEQTKYGAICKTSN